MQEFRLQQEWTQIIGEHIGSHTYPGALRKGKLFLFAENSVWLQQLLFLKTELLAKITEVVGQNVINDIILRVGYQPPVPVHFLTRVSAEEPTPAEPTIEGDLLNTVRELVQGIGDPVLRDCLRALFLKSAGAVSQVISDQPRLETAFAGSPSESRLSSLQHS